MTKRRHYRAARKQIGAGGSAQKLNWRCAWRKNISPAFAAIAISALTLVFVKGVILGALLAKKASGAL